MPITKGYRQLVDEAMAQVKTYTVAETRARLADPKTQLVDIRDIRELQAEGTVPGAFHAPRGMLEFWVDPASPYHKPVFADEGKEYVLFCGAGWRSALAAKALQDMGMTNVAHMDEGWAGWVKAGAPTETLEEQKARRQKKGRRMNRMGIRFDAVLFDCDGVLVDSEPITNGVLRDMLEELGWKLTPRECMRIFVGKALHEEAGIIEAHTGQPVTEAWLTQFRERRNAGLVRDVHAIRNAVSAVSSLHAWFAGRIACASGADRYKVELQLTKCGLMHFFGGSRIFSGYEMPRSKPAPDVYLAAAAALGVDPKKCVVVEDSVTGVTAGVAAGATVVGYSPDEIGHGSPEALRAAGAVLIFRDMAELPGLVRAVD